MTLLKQFITAQGLLLPSQLQTAGFYDDFTEFAGSTTAGAATWYLFETGGSGSTVALDRTLSNGVLSVTQSATDNDVCQQARNAGLKLSDLKSGQPIFFGGRHRTPATVADFDLYLGLFGAPSGTFDNDLVGGFVDGVALKVGEGSAVLSLVCQKDSGTQASVTLGTLAASTWIDWAAMFTPTIGNSDTGLIQVMASHNGQTWEASLPVVDQFPDDEVLFYNLFWQAGNTSAENMKHDYVFCIGTRADRVAGVG